MSAQKSVRTILGALSLLAVLGILVCTLWPFQPFPPNEVSWLPESQGIRFGKSGVVLTRQPLSAESGVSTPKPCSLELWMRPVGTQAVSTVLDFYRPDNPFQFQVRQYHDGLIVSRDFPGLDGKLNRSKIDLDHGLGAGKLTFLTLSFSERGTFLYLDGVLKETYPKFSLSADELAGQLILGTAPVNSQTWLGEIHGLALYANDLSPETVRQHYQEWLMRAGQEDAEQSARIAAYFFREGQGQTIHAQPNGAADLLIPPHFAVPHQAFLTAPWNEFDPGWEYWADVVRNIIGFMPLGIFLCAFLSFTWAPRRAILLSVLAGFALSLIVEVVQAYLPQRVSGMTDILTNSSGAALGALIGASERTRRHLGRLGALSW
jgi:VanZ family protein